MLPIISQADLGHPTEPGSYDYNGADVQVENRHISAWAEDPGASFRAILCNRVGDTGLRFALGSRTTAE